MVLEYPGTIESLLIVRARVIIWWAVGIARSATSVAMMGDCTPVHGSVKKEVDVGLRGRAQESVGIVCRAPKRATRRGGRRAWWRQQNFAGAAESMGIAYPRIRQVGDGV